MIRLCTRSPALRLITLITLTGGDLAERFAGGFADENRGRIGRTMSRGGNS